MAGTYEAPVGGQPRKTEEKKTRLFIEGVNGLLNSENKIPGTSLAPAAGITGTQLSASAAIADTQLASPNNSAYKQLFFGGTAITLDAPAGTYIFANAPVGAIQSGANIVSNAVPPYFYFDDADYTVSGKTQKLRLRFQVACNATKATIKFTTGLYPVTVAGAADQLSFALGTVVSGSTVEVNEPAASTVSTAVGSDFTIPADGAYALGVVTSGTLTNNSAVLLSAQLQTRSV
jgi:hypothetical protein